MRKQSPIDKTIARFLELYGVCSVRYSLSYETQHSLNRLFCLLLDCGAVSGVYNAHHFAQNDVEAASFCLEAGCDWACDQEYAKLQNAVEQVPQHTFPPVVFSHLSIFVSLSLCLSVLICLCLRLSVFV